MSTVLFRRSLAESMEWDVCVQHFRTTESRMDVSPNTIVVGRYSVLPYYDELEADLARIGSRLINTWADHKYIADIRNWADGALRGLTPKTWSSWAALPQGSYVLKGLTNSRKFQWSTHMFAPTREAVPLVASRLYEDTMIREQGLVVREFVPLRNLDWGINGLPVSNEWRTFWLVVDGTPVCISRSFYWSGSHPDAQAGAHWGEEAESLGYEAARRVAAEGPQFFVLDLAERASGGWVVIEVNDGQMSGLSSADPHHFYSRLAQEMGKVEALYQGPR